MYPCATPCLPGLLGSSGGPVTAEGSPASDLRARAFIIGPALLLAINKKLIQARSFTFVHAQETSDSSFIKLLLADDSTRLILGL